MKIPYSKFWQETNEVEYSSEDLELISHGSDKDSFKKSFEDSYNKEGVEMYRKSNPKTLRIGFVVIDGDDRKWHTVRLAAWTAKINGITCNNFRKEMLGEK